MVWEMKQAGPEGERWQISEVGFLTSRWSSFISLLRLRGLSIIYCSASHVNTILKLAHYVPLKHTDAFNVREHTQTIASALPPLWTGGYGMILIILYHLDERQIITKREISLALWSLHTEGDFMSNTPRCTGLSATGVSFFYLALGTKWEENM